MPLGPSELEQPRPLPLRVHLPPQPGVPAASWERAEILQAIGAYFTRERIQKEHIVPPVPVEQLQKVTRRFLKEKGYDAKFLNYVTILVNNELWRETFAAVPYDRRLLLLPKCLRVENQCPATFDEFGLLCKGCGRCSIQDLQAVAEKLGYAVLVAEGSPIVMSIIETGQIDAILGVSCMNVLERAFPCMEASAIPGLAIPLLQDGCKNTSVDEDWVWDAIHLTTQDRTRRMNLSQLRAEIDSWFGEESLPEFLAMATGETEKIGHNWLARGGKRWRPLLAVAIHQALQEEPSSPVPDDLKRIAVAVECFHKASLVHDDIEDEDEVRYGEETLQRQHGVPVALNVGDYLLGEGYRLLAECGAPAEVKVELLRVASRGHRALSLGQGAELCWAREPRPLSSREVLTIFRQKTAPAFEVALRLGLAYACSSESVRASAASMHEVIEKYSRALGIAYQIHDDLSELSGGDEARDLAALRPTLLLALALEKARKGKGHPARELLEAVWKRQVPADFDPSQLKDVYEQLGVSKRARELLQAYKREAVQSLLDVDNPNVKGLLRRIVGKLFGDTQIQGWCDEFETRNAADRPAGSQPAA